MAYIECSEQYCYQNTHQGRNGACNFHEGVIVAEAKINLSLSRAARATQKLSITIHEKGRTSFEEENFKKLMEAQLQNLTETKPKIQKVVLVHFKKNIIEILLK